MCGLTAISIGKRYRKDELKRVKELFTQILLAHEERGREATGVVIIWPDSHYLILKRPIPASEFIKTPEYRDFLKEWDKKVCTVQGHTRKPTKGSTWNEDNNHPLIIGDIVGVHNGTIKNDDLLFKKENLQRIAQVDSEVIFSMLNNIYNNCTDHHSDFVSEVQECTKKMTGTFTTISVNLRNPCELLLLKYNQPLSYHYSHSLETLFFTSRYIFLRKAFGRSVITEALPSKTAYLFNLNSNSESRSKPVIQFPIVSADNNIKKNEY
ncbi:MAG: class II glutamine amidotransferase [Candidatus Aminicenantes bacterium]|nr:class II glutamine amidotransferase [Candidatus Aminicenantes bacterium]